MSRAVTTARHPGGWLQRAPHRKRALLVIPGCALDGWRVEDEPAAAQQGIDVPSAFHEFLLYERGASPHTVRAYIADVQAALDFAEAAGAREVGDVDTATLRNWPAHRHSPTG